jgi:predicted molibdopterin-dependent oxidoreductase YjgC
VSARVALTVDGERLEAEATASLAAALLAVGRRRLRDAPRSGEPRGLWCGMGVCFDCLVTVDGRPGVRACLTRVRDGMRVETR